MVRTCPEVYFVEMFNLRRGWLGPCASLAGGSALTLVLCGSRSVCLGPHLSFGDFLGNLPPTLGVASPLGRRLGCRDAAADVIAYGL